MLCVNGDKGFWQWLGPEGVALFPFFAAAFEKECVCLSSTPCAYVCMYVCIHMYIYIYVQTARQEALEQLGWEVSDLLSELEDSYYATPHV
jgi:hypothetical protein